MFYISDYNHLERNFSISTPKKIFKSNKSYYERMLGKQVTLLTLSGEVLTGIAIEESPDFYSLALPDDVGEMSNPIQKAVIQKNHITALLFPNQ